MKEYLESVFSGNGFMPHGHCYFWTPGLVWLHVIADALIVVAYFSIPLTLVYFVRHRKDLTFGWMFVCFATFILACGTTHLMEIWNVWHSHYWLSGGIKALTALASVPTAILLARLLPASLALPSPAMLTRANVALEAEVRNRRVAEETVSKLNVELEARVAERTADLKRANEDLLREIAERKQAEEALRESEERFRSYFELGLIGMATTSPAKGLLEVNEEFCRILGYERSELLRMSWTEFTHPEDLAADVANFDRVAAGEIDGYSMDKRFIRKDGQVIDATISGKVLRHPDGSIDYFVAFLQDITERKRAEETLAEQSVRYKTLMETSADSIYILNEQGGLMEANAAFLHRRGYTAAEATTLHVADWDVQWTREQLQKRLSTWVNEGGVFETQHRCKDGSVFDVEASRTRVQMGEQAVFFCVARDITERKQAERALQERDERFRQITENINEIFWVWTVERGQKQCLYVSPAYATIWGRSCESLYAAPGSWREALHPGDRELVLAEFSDPDVTAPIDLTYRIVRPDQSIRWIRDRIFPVRDAQGVVIRSAGIAEDITESKKAEEIVRKANQQLRILSRRRIQEQEDERRRLSRELHDQIGQSLTAAKINVDVVRRATSPGLAGRLDETVAILDDLLGQVRQISLDLRPPSLDDLGLVPALRSWLDEQGRRASVSVRFSAEGIPETLDPEIQITCFRIAQEAITNAVRHAAATEIEIALRCARGKKLQLLARDNGIGFDARPAQAQAVDLGLIGIRERAALVGGRAKITSSPSKGTTIQVSLPLTLRPEPQGSR